MTQSTDANSRTAITQNSVQHYSRGLWSSFLLHYMYKMNLNWSKNQSRCSRSAERVVVVLCLFVCLLVSTVVRDHMNFIQFREDKLGATKLLPWRYVKTCFTVGRELLSFYQTYENLESTLSFCYKTQLCLQTSGLCQDGGLARILHHSFLE